MWPTRYFINKKLCKALSARLVARQPLFRIISCLDKYSSGYIVLGVKVPVETSDSAFQLCRLIGRLRAEFVAELEREVAGRGVELNFTQFLALKVLGASDEPMAPGELARTLHYNPGAMTRLLDKLEQRGYLRRVPDPADRRALRLELTKSGRAARERLIEFGSTSAERLFEGVGQRDRDIVRTVLSRVLENIEASRRPPAPG